MFDSLHKRSWRSCAVNNKILNHGPEVAWILVRLEHLIINVMDHARLKGVFDRYITRVATGTVTTHVNLRGHMFLLLTPRPFASDVGTQDREWGN